MALSVVLLLALCVWPRGAEYFAAGPLSHSHRQILGSALADDRCAACHPGAQGSASNWFASINTAGHQGVTQTDLCLNCHHTRMPRETARSPHGLSPQLLISLTEKTKQSAQATTRPWFIPHQPMQDLACAACHREHHGDTPSFTALNDQQCQTCHTQAFTSFGNGHPEWQSWPYDRGGQIHFDHRTHSQKHFAAKQSQWDCRTCHALTPQGEVARTMSFEHSCAQCHDATMKEQASEGFVLLQFPSINLERLTQAGIASETIPEWPEAAQGFDEIQLPPLMRLMLNGQDPAFANDDTSTKLDAAQTVELMKQVRRLAQTIATQGQTGIIEKLRAQGVPQTQARVLSATFPSQILLAAPWQATRRIADKSTIRQMQFTDDLLAPLPDPKDPLLIPNSPQANDDLLTEPLTPVTPQSSAPASHEGDLELQFVGGGWHRNDTTLTLRYLPTGHADERLRALVELALTIDHSENSNIASIHQELRASGTVQSCLKCHTPVQVGETWNWRAISMDQKPPGFTKFSHRPHLHQPELQSCAHCHTVNPEAVLESELNSSGYTAEFVSISKSACVQCHTKNAAGDHCIQCHRYHVDGGNDLLTSLRLSGRP